MISTGVRFRICGCGARILTALAEGVPVAVDPAVVGPLAEVAGIGAGRLSYDLVRVYGRSELMFRDWSRMGHRDWPVVLSHPCGRIPTIEDPAENWKKNRGEKAATRKGTPVAGDPPF